jgi:hypothetical protein
MTMRRGGGIFAAGFAAVVGLSVTAMAQNAATPVAEEIENHDPDIDIYALMSGKCTTLNIAGRDFACRAVGFFHSEKGRVNFTVAVDDPADAAHIVSFSGIDTKRPQDNLYVLAIDRMLLSSKDRPKADGLPIPAVELSAGVCRQLGNFAALRVSSVYCSASTQNGSKYELKFESDGAPIILRRVRQTLPNIPKGPFE